MTAKGSCRRHQVPVNLLGLTVKQKDQPQIKKRWRKKTSHITNRSQSKEDKGNQDNAGSKLILEKTIISVLGKIREDFAHMKKKTRYYLKKQSKYKNESVEN